MVFLFATPLFASWKPLPSVSAFKKARTSKSEGGGFLQHNHTIISTPKRLGATTVSRNGRSSNIEKTMEGCNFQNYLGLMWKKKETKKGLPDSLLAEVLSTKNCKTNASHTRARERLR
mmetsp:Transcript_58454/g.123994  ORF Transcript_58454/g.123994 Transcript_58454/m.123994 type:complete len:118 (-) Transcript_58454:1165-1518(-)